MIIPEELFARGSTQLGKFNRSTLSFSFIKAYVKKSDIGNNSFIMKGEVHQSFKLRLQHRSKDEKIDLPMLKKLGEAKFRNISSSKLYETIFNYFYSIIKDILNRYLQDSNNIFDFKEFSEFLKVAISDIWDLFQKTYHYEFISSIKQSKYPHLFEFFENSERGFVSLYKYLYQNENILKEPVDKILCDINYEIFHVYQAMNELSQPEELIFHLPIHKNIHEEEYFNLREFIYDISQYYCPIHFFENNEDIINFPISLISNCFGMSNGTFRNIQNEMTGRNSFERKEMEQLIKNGFKKILSQE